MTGTVIAALFYIPEHTHHHGQSLSFFLLCKIALPELQKNLSCHSATEDWQKVGMTMQQRRPHCQINRPELKPHRAAIIRIWAQTGMSGKSSCEWMSTVLQVISSSAMTVVRQSLMEQIQMVCKAQQHVASSRKDMQLHYPSNQP